MYPESKHADICYQKNERAVMHTRQETGDRLNKKDGLTRYGNSHVKDKTS